MTPKQSVLAIYPDAFCDHNGPFGMHKIVRPHANGIGYVYLGVLAITSRYVWQYAWDRIKQQMIEKLEKV